MPKPPKAQENRPEIKILNKKEAVSTKTPPVKDNTKEIGGQSGPEPTRYGDWEKGGRCTDF